MPLNPFSQSSEQNSIQVHSKLNRLKDEDKINENENENRNENENVIANGGENEQIKAEEKEKNENHDQFVMKKGEVNVHWNPFHYLSLLVKYVYGSSDINTKFKTFPSIEITASMDLLDSRLEGEGRINRRKDL